MVVRVEMVAYCIIIERRSRHYFEHEHEHMKKQ